MNKKVAAISGLVIVGLIGGVALLGNNDKKEDTSDKKEVVTVEHAVGTTEVAEEPQKVVVFDYAALDAMQALEIQDKVVATAQDSSIPEYLGQYKGAEFENVGGLKEPNLEKINSLEPDLIIINGRQHSFYDQLSDIAPTISMSKEDGKYMEDFTKNMEVIGDIFNKEAEVKAELDEINAKVEEVKTTVEEEDLYATTLMVSDGTLSVFGADSRFGLIYNNLGFKNTDGNVEAADHGQDVSFEYVASQDSDYMFVVDKSVIMSDENQKPAEEILNNDLVNSTKAAKEGNIVYLDTHAWYLADGGLISTNTMIDEIIDALNK